MSTTSTSSSTWLLAGLAVVGIAGIWFFTREDDFVVSPPSANQETFCFRGRPFRVFQTEHGDWKVDLGDELHVKPTKAAAVAFAKKRIQSDDPPRFGQRCQRQMTLLA